jgi:hypothetical protein
MVRRWNNSWALLAAGNALVLCMLGLYGTLRAEPREGNLPFPVQEEQRQDMITVLTDIRDLLKQQNALLRSGNLRVVASPPKKR